MGTGPWRAFVAFGLANGVSEQSGQEVFALNEAGLQSKCAVYTDVTRRTSGCGSKSGLHRTGGTENSRRYSESSS